MDFWDSNLNPITMMPAPILVRDNAEYEKFTNNSIKKNDICANMTRSTEIMKQLGVGARKLKSMFASIGINPLIRSAKSYYPTKEIENLRGLMDENIPVVDKSNYISNQELMQMFGINDHKAWKIAKENHLAKKKFNGNGVYYEKEKAIEVFSKYQK